MSQKHQKHMLIHPLPNEWKLPLNLAVGFHILVLFCAMVLPGLLHHQTKLPEITTIDLVNMAEPSAKNEPAAPAAKQETPPATKQEATPPPPPKPPETLKPEVTKQIPPPSEKAIPVPEPTVTPEPAAPAAPPAPVEAISIKPLKQKVKKEVKEPPPDTRVEDTKIRKEELKNITKKLQEEAKKESAVQETIRLQRQQAAAREEARRAELEARMAAADAKNALRDQLRATPSASSSPVASSQSGTSNGQSKNILETQYQVTIAGIIKQHWQPPDVKAWDPNIFALVTIIVANDGQIVSKIIDQGSGDSLFDQFVLKTLEAVNPLPPPPPALQKQRLELSYSFKPSGIQ